MKKSEISAAALSMLGTPFHAQGRLPGVGLDCIGVVACVAKAIGFQFQDRSAYSMNPTGELQPALEQYLIRVDKEPEEGDILLMAWRGYAPHHVAVYVGDGCIVHAYNKARKVVRQAFSDEWKLKTVAVYRFPGVD